MSQKYLSHGQVATSGNQQDGNRTIEAAISWQDIADNVSRSRQPNGNLLSQIKAGLRFGCEPLVISNDWRSQFYIGGIEKPTGRDKNSRDIILVGK